jgi:hypothetical protein
LVKKITISKWIRPAEIARDCSVSSVTVMRWRELMIVDGVDVCQVGNTWLISRTGFDQWLGQHRVTVNHNVLDV